MLIAKIKLIATPVLALGVSAGAGLSTLGDGRAAEPPPAASGPSGQGENRSNASLLFEVRRGDLKAIVLGRGSLESPDLAEVRSPIEGEATILMLLPEGTKVVEDQLIAELDALELKTKLNDQQIVTGQAEAEYETAVKAREIAQINLKEYEEGIFPQELKTVEGEIKLAESALERAEDRLDWSKKMDKLGYISQADHLENKDALAKAEFNLEQAERKREVLQKFTYPKQVKALEVEIEKANADELAKKAALEVEKDREERLRHMIDQCKIHAPGDGLITHARDWRQGDQLVRVREGAKVREGQNLLMIFDPGGPMRVNTKVHESMIDQVKPGMSARILVDAFPNELFDGTVTEIEPLPDPASFFQNKVKVYTTLIDLDEPHLGLRPGMTAEAQIAVKEETDLLGVPPRAVLQHDRKSYVAVRRPEGGFDWREVELGFSDGELVEVKQGLRHGDLVALDPLALIRRISTPDQGEERDVPED